ncbi:MAG: hypothetical protein CVU38_06560 [Chloroflexi bacterium HGW-Chloroflexi-1]|nr:MAG: hypothetical protein CVU38_06560 [Chloroflexi bacterium HGW-Chloroflexi-1]
MGGRGPQKCESQEADPHHDSQQVEEAKQVAQVDDRKLPPGFGRRRGRDGLRGRGRRAGCRAGRRGLGRGGSLLAGRRRGRWCGRHRCWFSGNQCSAAGHAEAAGRLRHRCAAVGTGSG